MRARATLLAISVLISGSALQTWQPGAPTRGTREDAYRANNLGVARLEQFDYPAAAQAFRRAVELAPDLTMARVNLALALYYAGDLAPARAEAERARERDPKLLPADYVLGLIARAENRNADALAAFERVGKADPEDLGSAINLGQLYLQEQKFGAAVDAFRRATRLEPYQATAAYGLATALLRSGARDEGAAAMAHFQKLRDSGYATTFSQNYLEQGRYAAAIASTGAEPELVETGTPKVTFSDVTATVLQAPATPVSGPTLFDVDADGDLDLALATTRGVVLLRNERGRFSRDATDLAGIYGGSTTAVAFGDFNNDERPDLLVLGQDGGRLLAQQPDRGFKDVTANAGLPKFPARSAAWSDADHDGDLDIVAPPFLWRNNGNGSFSDVSAAAGLTTITGTVAIAPVDFDNRRDIDFLALRHGASPALLQNMRDGSFRDTSESVGLSRVANWSGVAAADVNKDGFVDFCLSQLDGPASLAISDGRGRFTLSDVQADTPRGNVSRAAMFLDYDNDGLLDALLVTPRPFPTLLRNIGTGWRDVSAHAFPRPDTGQTGDSVSAQLTAGDFDGDGDTDVIVARDGRLTIWRNDGGNQHASLKVQLSSRVSNRSALGSKVEMRAGSLSQQLESASAAPSPAPADLVFGLGNRSGADVVRVLWPAGILQAEVGTDGQLLTGQLPIRELDRKPSSCPYLYTWNGSRFEFVTDFLGGGEMGYWLAPGLRNTPDPDEYVRIEGRDLQSRAGRYELRITNELEEALFLDRAQLIVVEHREGTEVYPDEGMADRPKPFSLFVTRDARPPLAATDEHGHDVLPLISSRDRTYPDDFAIEHVRGYAKPHALTLTLPAARPHERRILLLTGWTDYAFSRDNVAASQQGLTLLPPSLEVKDATGKWRTVIEDIGVPVGRPQTVPVDLTDVLPPNASEIRIRTTMRIYWDRIAVAERVPVDGAQRTVPLLSATLRWRGFSAEVTPDGREPFTYDYDRVTADSPWKLMPGRYTREGDVRELLARVDDMFVTSRSGDEVALSFDANALGALPRGWTRTFLLFSDGFSKEMDHHSSSPDTLEPLPFHRMTAYPYAHPERYPDDEAHRRYLEHYNTRVVLRSVPRIDTSLSLSSQRSNTQK